MKKIAASLAAGFAFAAFAASAEAASYEGIYTLEDEGGRFVPCGEGEAWRLEPSPAIEAQFDKAIAKVIKAFQEGMGASPEDGMLPYFYLGVVAEVSASAGDRRYSKHAVATALNVAREATDEDFARCDA